MEYFMGLGLVLLFIVPFFSFASIITLSTRWKYYKSEYEKLASYTFKKVRDQVWAEENWHFVYFTEVGTIGTQRMWLHNAFYTYFDPYSLYWLIKFNRYMKRNVLPNLNTHQKEVKKNKVYDTV